MPVGLELVGLVWILFAGLVIGSVFNFISTRSLRRKQSQLLSEISQLEATIAQCPDCQSRSPSAIRQEQVRSQ